LNFEYYIELELEKHTTMFKGVNVLSTCKIEKEKKRKEKLGELKYFFKLK